MSYRSVVRVLLSWCVCGGIPVVPVLAQTVTATTGALNGVVIDSSKAVVPGVAVSLFGSSVMTLKSTTTDASGVFRFSAVPPGDYAIRFERQGFATILRDKVRVGLGFTATVDVELQPGGVNDRVVVSGAPGIDVTSPAVGVHFDRHRLATLPGARDIFALLASTPGVAMARPDVGGNGGLALQDYTAYGLRATTGVNRNEVEGIRVGAANGANDNYFSDYASFDEIAIKAAGNSSAMPVPGTWAQYVSKSGGNAYRGTAYADIQDGRWQSTNVDADQRAAGVSGGPRLDADEVNRLERFRDFTADVGGYVTKDKVWWYAGYRDTEVKQRYPWLLDRSAALTASVVTGKVTYKHSPRQTLVGYVQHQRFAQTSFFPANVPQPIQTSDALPRLESPISVWKGEYSATLTDTMYGEVRVGAYASAAKQFLENNLPRIVDTGANTVSGASFAGERLTSRPQVNGSLSFTTPGWLGDHTVRLGGEYMIDRVDYPFFGYGGPCNCISTLNNGVPTQVQIYLGSNTSSNDLETVAGFVHDTWRLHRRITLSLGLRLDRYRPILPEQAGPAGQAFPAIDPVLTFNNWGTRLGMSADLSGDGKTVVKLHYGHFWLYPGPNFTAAFNPNPIGWSRTYRWMNDANANGSWDPGEEAALIAVTGGTTSTRLDPAIVNTNVHQGMAYLEREVATDVVVRTGLVLNARRAAYGTINVNRPLSAYSVPVAVVDPGPDGRLDSADDGATLTAFNLSPEALALPLVNLTTNLPGSDADYYTWEVTATKRQSAGWSLLASFTNTWNREAALGTGNDFTPNALINASGSQLRFTTWQAKLYTTLDFPVGLRVVPVVRSQSGTPFARTFVRTLNYGNATIKAQPITANRTPAITLLDVRTEKAFRISRAQVIVLFDVYNVLNSNAEQAVTFSSGASWLRPTAITGPRILRIGARLEW